MVPFTSPGQLESASVYLDRFSRDVSSLERMMWVIVVLAMALDVLLTLYGLRIGLVERNPVIRPAIHAFGIAALVVAKLVALLVGVAFRFVIPRYAVLIPIGLAVPWVLAVVNNTILILVVETGL